jgi:hypothetical protein
MRQRTCVILALFLFLTPYEIARHFFHSRIGLNLGFNLAP